MGRSGWWLYGRKNKWVWLDLRKIARLGGITEQFPSVLPIVIVVIILSCLDGVLVETSSLTATRRGATSSHSPLSH
jgi:hypothetical protein